MDSYQNHLIAEGLSDRTVEQYTRMLDRAMEWCAREAIHLETATATEVKALAASFPRSYATRGILRATLKRYWESIDRDRPPVGAVKLGKTPHYRNRALNPQDAMALAKAAQYWYPQGVAVAFGLYMGLRAGEIASAEWSRVEADGWYCVTGKGDKTVPLPIHPLLAEDLRYARKQAPGRFVFPGSRGRQTVTPQTIWNWTHQVADAAGIPTIHPHQLRHTAITEVHDRTGKLRRAQEFARHSNPRTTQIYTRVTDAQLKTAVEAIDYFNPIEDQ